MKSAWLLAAKRTMGGPPLDGGPDHRQVLDVRGLPETAYLAFGMLVLCGALFPWLKLRPEYGFLHPGLLYILAIAVLALGGLVLLFPVRRQVLTLACRDWQLTLLIAWMLLSLAWSVAPASRPAILAGLATSTIYGCHLALARPRVRVYRILGLTLLALVLISLAIYAANPNIRTMDGLFSNRNILVRLGVLGIPLAGLMVLTGNRSSKSPAIVVSALILAAAGIFMALEFYAFTAKSSLFVFAALVLLLWAARRSRRIFLFVLLGEVLFAAAVLVELTSLLHYARETSGLHNRLHHWSMLLSQHDVSPLWGAGLGAYWDEESGPWKHLPLKVALRHGHNGFIDTWLDLGLIGLVCLANVMIAIVIRALKVPLREWTAEALLASALFAAFVAYNLTESSLLPTNSANTLMWAILVALSWSVTSRVSLQRNPPIPENSA